MDPELSPKAEKLSERAAWSAWSRASRASRRRDVEGQDMKSRRLEYLHSESSRELGPGFGCDCTECVYAKGSQLLEKMWELKTSNLELLSKPQQATSFQMALARPTSTN